MRQDLKIAVTGSSGFVGSALVRKLAEGGAEVIEVDLAGGIDITDWAQVKDLPRFDVLMHLAAKTFVPDSYENPRDFYFTNVVSTMNVLELCRQREARMVFTSSYVYGRPRRLPIDESHPLAAFNPYAQTKLIGEALCEGYHRDFDLRVVILRPFNIYGPKQSGPFLIPTIINQAESGKIILKDPDPRRDLLYRDDVVNAYVKAAEYTRAPFEIFNLGLGKSYSVREIVEIIAGQFAADIEIEFTGEKRKNEVMDTVADISKAKKLLGWEPQVSFEQGARLSISGSE